MQRVSKPTRLSIHFEFLHSAPNSKLENAQRCALPPGKKECRVVRSVYYFVQRTAAKAFRARQFQTATFPYLPSFPFLHYTKLTPLLFFCSKLMHYAAAAVPEENSCGYRPRVSFHFEQQLMGFLILSILLTTSSAPIYAPPELRGIVTI